MSKVVRYKPKQENVNKLKQYLAYITKTKKSNCNIYGKH
jgi:hypothetical protein